LFIACRNAIISLQTLFRKRKAKKILVGLKAEARSMKKVKFPEINSDKIQYKMNRFLDHGRKRFFIIESQRMGAAICES
jgi:hypothetical protein